MNGDMRGAKFAIVLTTFSSLTVLAGLYRPAEAVQTGQPSDLRAPFVLELPEIGLKTVEPEARIQTSELRTIKFLVRKPFSDSINLGKVYIAINGESGGLALGVNPGLDGHVATCDLARRPSLKLHPGKNVIELSACDQRNKWYYASFVLLAGGQPVDDPSLSNGATIRHTPGRSGSDPPQLIITEPKGLLRGLAVSITIPVRGFVTVGSGMGVSLTINGKPATLAPASSSRALVISASGAGGRKTFAFDSTAALTARTSTVVVEAKDDSGGVTVVTIPISGRQAAPPAQFRGRKFAVVIGVSRYKYHDGGLHDLGYADADARAIREFLLRPQGGGFAEGDILYLENENATADAVRDGLMKFLRIPGPNDLIVVFIAGHGAPDPYDPRELYFLMHDTKVADMSRTALPMRELQQALDGIVRAQRVVVFVDTCHAAGLSGKNLTTTRGLENNLINLYSSRLYKEAGRAVLTSSDVNEMSHESAEWGGGHGVFTLALLDGLGGDADSNQDGFITAGELFSYVRDRVRKETGFQQNPRALPGLNTDLTLAAAPKR
jgi:hypothetical protein